MSERTAKNYLNMLEDVVQKQTLTSLIKTDYVEKELFSDYISCLNYYCDSMLCFDDDDDDDWDWDNDDWDYDDDDDYNYDWDYDDEEDYDSTRNLNIIIKDYSDQCEELKSILYNNGYSANIIEDIIDVRKTAAEKWYKEKMKANNLEEIIDMADIYYIEYPQNF
jgi:hypothetical protein